MEQWLFLAGIGGYYGVDTDQLYSGTQAEWTLALSPRSGTPCHCLRHFLTGCCLDRHLSTTSTIGISLITMGGVIICRRSQGFLSKKFESWQSFK